jgi:hypothetical protein
MAIKVKPFSKGAVVDIKAPKPVNVNASVSINKNSNTQIYKNTYAPEFEGKDVDVEAQIRENIYAPEDKVENRGSGEAESVYAPHVNVYVSNVMTDYAKAYLQMLLKLIEETYSED